MAPRKSPPSDTPAPAGFDAFVGTLRGWLPAGWCASLQIEDPLTHTLEEVAATGSEARTGLLALAPLPEGFTGAPAPWLLSQVGFAQVEVFPLAGEGPFGRLLLVAGDDAPLLDDHRAELIRQHCAAACSALERARSHREDEKFSTRLRRLTESELAERFTDACLGLVPRTLAAVVMARQDGLLKVLKVRRQDGARTDDYERRRIPFDDSHLAALTRPGGGSVRAVVPAVELTSYTEGMLFAPLLEQLRSERVETVPLESRGRVVGSLLLFHLEEKPSGRERSASGYLARTLSLALDRLRPERRQASSLLYLQELLRPSEAGLVPILRTVVEEFVRFMGADAGVLALLDADTGTLLLSEHTGYGRRTVMPAAIPLDEEPRGDETSISAQVIRTGEPYLAADTQQSAFYLPVDPSIRSEIAVPLRLRGDTVGVALGSSRTAGFFMPEDISRFQLFVDQVAVAVDNARLLDSLRQQREKRMLHRQRRTFGFHPSLQAEDVEYHFGNLVGDPRGAFGQVYRTIERVAAREDDTVLIIGETGSGKEMIAHAIHNASPRRSRPLVATNFAALGGDPNLIQSELFGHEKGSFTGAVRRRRGCFEKAHRSTLLIDELGDIVPSVQVKLLRVLGPSSKREFTRLGGEETNQSDVRVLAATNKDLRREMAEGRFREDLYYRLSALVVRIPPLRARPEDIPILSRHFLARLGKSRPIRVGRGAFRELQAYSWPGNVRQLESVLLRSLVMFGSQTELTSEDIRQALALEVEGLETTVLADRRLDCPSPAPSGWFWDQVWEPWKGRKIAAAAVRDLLHCHLAETGGYYSKVAARLGVDRRDYQRFLDFLKHSGLKVDHRPHRVKQG